jgi:hypothetical protein
MLASDPEVDKEVENDKAKDELESRLQDCSRESILARAWAWRLPSDRLVEDDLRTTQ